jgi:hypothetical protein
MDANATIAFFIPRCLAIFIAQALSQDHFAERNSMTWAAVPQAIEYVRDGKLRPLSPLPARHGAAVCTACFSVIKPVTFASHDATFSLWPLLFPPDRRGLQFSSDTFTQRFSFRDWLDLCWRQSVGIFTQRIHDHQCSLVRFHCPDLVAGDGLVDEALASGDDLRRLWNRAQDWRDR